MSIGLTMPTAAASSEPDDDSGSCRPVANRGLDCLRCGACCVSPYTGGAYVALSDSEAVRLTSARLPVIVQRQGGEPPDFLLRLGTKQGSGGTNVCTAFAGAVGSSCSCSIYEQRPAACRQFEAGGRSCHEARQRTGIAAGPGPYEGRRA